MYIKDTSTNLRHQNITYFPSRRPKKTLFKQKNAKIQVKIKLPPFEQYRLCMRSVGMWENQLLQKHAPSAVIVGKI